MFLTLIIIVIIIFILPYLYTIESIFIPLLSLIIYTIYIFILRRRFYPDDGSRVIRFIRSKIAYLKAIDECNAKSDYALGIELENAGSYIFEEGIYTDDNSGNSQ